MRKAASGSLIELHNRRGLNRLPVRIVPAFRSRTRIEGKRLSARRTYARIIRRISEGEKGDKEGSERRRDRERNETENGADREKREIESGKRDRGAKEKADPRKREKSRRSIKKLGRKGLEDVKRRVRTNRSDTQRGWEYAVQDELGIRVSDDEVPSELRTTWPSMVD